MPRSMHTCQVSVSRTVSGREQVGSDGTIPLSGRERVGSDGTVLNSRQQRLGTGMREFRLESRNVWSRMGMVSAVTPFHFVIDEDMQRDAQLHKIEQCADGKPSSAAQPPHNLNPNTRLP